MEESEYEGQRLKRKVKDSVFTDLFSRKEYLIQLYRALHPEDAEASEADITIVTIQNVITDGLYNDLGFLVRDKLVVLAEAQSTWSENIVVRSLMYLAKTYNDYFSEHGTDLYSSVRIELPCPELYVIYTGEKKETPEELSLRQNFFPNQDSMLDVRVKVIRGGEKGDIISQYVAFTEICNEQMRLHGRTKQTVEEILRICMEDDILEAYLRGREKEVKDIMFTLYDEDEIMRRYTKTVTKKAQEEGMAQGMRQGVAQGMRQGVAQGIQTSIQNLMRKMKVSAEQAMDMLDIKPDERAKYAALLS